MKRIFILLTTLITVFATPISFALTSEQKKVLQSGIHYFNTESSACSSVGIVNGSVDRFLQVLAFQESGGNPTAQNSSSSASGKYQYIDKTWRSRDSIYGPSGEYSHAYQAPELVQDAVAYIEYTKKFRDYNNDLFQLAISHYLGSPTTDPAILDKVPSGGNSVTPRQYADKLIKNIGEGIGADIPLLYSQAPEFDTWLAKIGGATVGVNVSSNTSCLSASGGTIVEIAQRELSDGARESDNSYLKYTGGIATAWCAYFVSWVFEQAGKPFDGGPIPAVTSMLAYAQEKGYYHPKGEPGFTPQPGDVAIYNENIYPYPSHVNIVTSYDTATNKFTTIGGNESNTIRQFSWDADLPALTGFMRVP